MDTLEGLRRARARITDPQHWTQNEFARDRRGLGVAPSAPNAERWCGIGALVCEFSLAARVAWGLEEFEHALFLLGYQSQGRGFEAFNDSSSHAEVLRAYDEAIAAAEEVQREVQEVTAENYDLVPA